MRVAPGFSPSSVSLVQKEETQQKGDALISCAVVSKANALHLLSLWDTDAVVQRCSLLGPANLQVLLIIQPRHHPAVCCPCVQHCLLWEYLILSLLVVSWLGYSPGKLHRTHWMSPLFLEKGKAHGNPGELLGAGGSKSWQEWQEMNTKEQAAPRPFSPLHSCPSTEGLCARPAPWPCGTVTAGEVMPRGSGHEPQWPRLHTNKCPIHWCTKQVPCQRPCHGAELGMVLSFPGPVQGIPPLPPWPHSPSPWC